MEFKKAVKSQVKLKCALMGASGSGKTYSALAVASGMSDKIALIDTERESASLYADDFDFDAIDLADPTIDNYIWCINNAASKGYEVLIIDSLSHAWEYLVEKVDSIAEKKYRGNGWSAWSEGKPIQKSLINAILDFPGHIFITMRSKTHWDTESYGDNSGYKKIRPVKVGLAPEQKGNIEYEFDITLEMDMKNNATVSKTRYSSIAGKIISKPGAELGVELLEWLNSGRVVELAKPEQVDDAIRLVESLRIESTTVDKWLKKAGVSSFSQMKMEDIDKCINFMKVKMDAREAEDAKMEVKVDECLTAIDIISASENLDDLAIAFEGIGKMSENQSVIECHEEMKIKLAA